MGTADVIHSFWVPNLHGKIDMIPGATTTLRLDAHEPGEYIGICAEFCGIQHALMEFVVIASPVEEFEAWLANEASDAAEPEGELAVAGQEVFTATGCAACHAVRGTAAAGELGPDLTHFASRRTLGARTAPNDRDHLARWIVDAQELKPGNLMPRVPMSDAQLEALLAYVEGLE
jgi:cytochrome c oxidase subunit II